jgi:S-adenosyl-L-methionine hydrolase (adenosine-forming)
MGTRDYYVSSIKGTILTQLGAQATIVDITHQIDSWNTLQAAFVLRNAYVDFPKGTIHIIGVDTEASKNRKHIVIEANGHFFIGCDNGIFSLMFDSVEQIDKLIEININNDNEYKTFPTRDVFVKAACHLAKGGVPEVLGRAIIDKQINRLIIGDPVFDSNTQTIIGKIIYIDNYGNAITNITTQIFKSACLGRPFNLAFRPRSNRSLEGVYNFKRLAESYNEVDLSDLIVLVNNVGLIEIAMNQGNAQQMLDLGANLQIKFQFDNNR